MNLKGFKKIQEDEHSATLQNQRGHSIKLAKKQLSKSHTEALKKLPLYAADGVDVPEEDPSQEQPQEIEATGAGPEGVPLQSAENTTEPQVEPTQKDMQMPVEHSPEQVAAMHTQEANQEVANHWHDLMQGHIKPATYSDLFARKSTLGKIGTIFGMALSGIGSGLSGQPNALLHMMDKEIDNDLEAQKETIKGSQNYYHLNMQNELNKAGIKKTGAETTGLLKDVQAKAINNAKNGMMLGATHKILTDLNMLPPGPQKGAALQKFGEVQSAVSNEIQQNNTRLGQQLVSDPEGDFQKKQQGLNTAGNLGILPGAEGMARYNEEHHMPGTEGQSSNSIPGDVRQDLIAKKEYDQAARNYINFAKKHKSNWANLNAKDRAEVARQGAVLGAELQGKYRLKTKGGVYKTGEQEFIQRIIPDSATSWAASFNQIPKVEQTIKDNEMDMKNLSGGYGLKKTDEKPQQKEEQILKTKSGKPYVIRNGRAVYK